MAPRLDVPQGDSFSTKVEIYQETQRLSLIAGYIMASVQSAVRFNDPSTLIEILLQFCAENPEDLIDLSFMGLKPFQNLQAHNIIRFPDSVREESLIDNSTEKFDGESSNMVNFHAGEVYVRWVLPRPEFILKSKSSLKLAHLGFIVMEELLHLRQIIGPTTKAINTLSTMIEFNRIQSTNQMEQKDQELLASVLETDIAYFQDKYFGDMQELQWFKDRASATDYHKILTAQQFIDAIIYLCNKYGSTEDVSENILNDIFNAIDFNPYISLPMLLAPSLYTFIEHKRILFALMKYLTDYPEVVQNEQLAPIIGEVLKTLVSLDKEA